jgi:hypothetical protein
MIYQRMPQKFDYQSYYSQQAAGGTPNFPIFRARQRGGFIAPLLKRHGIPFLKWIGKQAASLATGMGNNYLEKGSLSKSDMKSLLKDQGKKSAKSALDAIRQQVGAVRGGASLFNVRRDARLGALVPLSTRQREGVMAPIRGVRASFPSEMTTADHALTSNSSLHSFPRKRKQSKRRKKSPVKSKKSVKKRKTTGKKKSKGRKLKKALTAIKNTIGRKKKIPKNQPSPHTIFS